MALAQLLLPFQLWLLLLADFVSFLDGKHLCDIMETVNPLHAVTGDVKEPVPPPKVDICYDCLVPYCVYGTCIGGLIATLAIFVR
jgi:hypothetical protein